MVTFTMEAMVGRRCSKRTKQTGEEKQGEIAEKGLDIQLVFCYPFS